MDLFIKLLPNLINGTKVTLLVFSVTLVISYPLSFVLTFLQSLNNKFINYFLKLYIAVERGTPLLLQLMFVYFGLPYFNILFDRMTSVLVAFILNYTAYFIEINRGGIEAIDKGQFEACKVLGYSKLDTYKLIVIPQAFKITLPSVSNEVLSLVKDTSLVYILGVTEVLKVGRTAVNYYATAVPFIYVGIIYLVITYIFAKILKSLEKRLTYYD